MKQHESTELIRLIEQDMAEAKTTHNGFSYRETSAEFRFSPRPNASISFEILEDETVVYKSKFTSLPIVRSRENDSKLLLAHPRIYTFPIARSDQNNFIYLNNNKLNTICTLNFSKGNYFLNAPGTGDAIVLNSEKELFIIKFAMRHARVKRPKANFVLEEETGKFTLTSYLCRDDSVTGRLTKERGALTFVFDHLPRTKISFEDTGRPYLKLLENSLFDAEVKANLYANAPKVATSAPTTSDDKSAAEEEGWTTRVTREQTAREEGKSL